MLRPKVGRLECIGHLEGEEGRMEVGSGYKTRCMRCRIGKTCNAHGKVVLQRLLGVIMQGNFC